MYGEITAKSAFGLETVYKETHLQCFSITVLGQHLVF